MEIKRNSDKRSDISELYFSELNNISFVDYPGIHCQCSGVFERIKFTTVAFQEEDPENGGSINQELSIVIRGQNKQIDDQVLDVTGKFLILKAVYSNGDVKIIGTPDNPVVLTSLKSEKPAMTTLTSTRTSAEKAKYLTV